MKGIVPPMVTPLLDDDTLDIEGLKKLIDHLIKGGVNGLFILGSTGEGPSLNYSLRIELIKRVCEFVDKRVPVLVGISDTSFRESVKIADHSFESGAKAVVTAPPYYYKINQSELRNFYTKLIKEISIPVLLYNQPALTKTYIEAELVNEMVSHPQVVGVKDSSGDMIYFNIINKLENRNKFSLLAGHEELLMEALLVGADGSIPAGANMFSGVYVNLYKKMVGNKDHGSALKLHNDIMKISSAVYGGKGNNTSNIVSSVKYALNFLGICNDHIAKPMQKISSKKASIIEKFINESHLTGDK